MYPLTVFRADTKHNTGIRVVLSGNTPELIINKALQSGAKLRFIWQKVFDFFGITKPHTERTRVLVLGIGGGDVITLMQKRFPNADIDAVDIDETVITIARVYFGIHPTKHLKIVNTDAIMYACKSGTAKDRYEVIVSDLYKGFEIPEMLKSKQFLMGLGHLLSPKGSLIINFSPHTDFSGEVRTMRVLLQSVFKDTDEYSYDTYMFFKASNPR